MHSARVRGTVVMTEPDKAVPDLRKRGVGNERNKESVNRNSAIKRLKKDFSRSLSSKRGLIFKKKDANAGQCMDTEPSTSLTNGGTNVTRTRLLCVCHKLISMWVKLHFSFVCVYTDVGECRVVSSGGQMEAVLQGKKTGLHYNAASSFRKSFD